MIRLLAALLPLLAIPCTVAQQLPAPAPAGSNWSRIQAPPAGTSLHLNGKPHTTCTFASATDDSIICTKDHKPVTYPRAGITTIKLTHRGRSAVAGLAMGAGAGAIIGFAGSSHQEHDIINVSGAITAATILIGGIIGKPIGYFTDFTAGSPIYKAH